tara:strand:+ start:3305 stop:4507 length:1203 start_codon:yes stop_codon:yes gene_type:complete
MENSTAASKLKSSEVSIALNATAAAALVLVVAGAGQLATHLGSSMTSGWPGFADLMHQLPEPLAWLRWFFGDMSEATFYKHELASVGMLVGALVAHWAYKRGKRWQGFAVSYGTGLLPWILLSSSLGLILSNLLWGWTITQSGAWQPTFVTFVSLPAAMVLMFGRGWKVAIVGGVMGALLVTPIALALVNYVCNPMQLPSVIGNVSAMALGSAVAFVICSLIPALVRNEREPSPAVSTQPIYGPSWTIRRVLADFTESPFIGNECASIGLIFGLLVAVSLNPTSPVYGSGVAVQVLVGQVLASALGVVMWRRQWMARGWYPTYIPVVSVSPAAILAYGDAPVVIGVSALLGAFLAPPLAAAVSDRLPKSFHPYIGNVISMAICTLVVLPIIGMLPGVSEP